MLALVACGCSGPGVDADGHGQNLEGEKASSAIEARHEGQAVVVRGVVEENTIDACRSPDPVTVCEEGIGHFLRLATDQQSVAVYFAGHHGEPCRNTKASGDAAEARVGAAVEVHAAVENVDGKRATLSVCDSSDYYVHFIR